MSIDSVIFSELLKKIDSELSEEEVTNFSNRLSLYLFKIIQDEKELDHVVSYDINFVKFLSRRKIVSEEANCFDVLKEYYGGTIEKSNRRRIFVKPYLLSEIMLMLGVFGIISETRSSVYYGYLNEKNSIKRRITSFFKVEKDSLDDKIKKEEVLCSYINVQIVTLLEGICNMLGIQFTDLSDKRIEEIILSSYSLATSYKNINAFKVKRCGDIPSVEDDILLFTSCGDTSNKLKDIKHGVETSKVLIYT